MSKFTILRPNKTSGSSLITLQYSNLIFVHKDLDYSPLSSQGIKSSNKTYFTLSNALEKHVLQ